MGTRINTALSLTALVVAVGGATPVGQAAWNAVVPRNSVGTAELKRNAVTAARLAPNAVRTAHILNGTLLLEDFKADQIPKGPKGDDGLPGVSGLQVVTATAFIAAGTQEGVHVSCPAGKKALGGGFAGLSGMLKVVASSPDSDLMGWLLIVKNDGTFANNVGVSVICAKVA
ncbi:hypothetical protein [Gaiella sp.]|uniref:hypothetical protein n=1 Tax=Gaiella sp. TaxID=2663207 RepID=UPI0039837165